MNLSRDYPHFELVVELVDEPWDADPTEPIVPCSGCGAADSADCDCWSGPQFAEDVE